jgi:hypothetical protein
MWEFLFMQQPSDSFISSGPSVHIKDAESPADLRLLIPFLLTLDVRNVTFSSSVRKGKRQAEDTMESTPRSTREILRHTLASLAYRATKTLRDAPPSFANFRTDANSRSPLEILAHLGDLIDWSLTHLKGAEKWHDATPLEWNVEIARFCGSLQKFDAYLAGNEPIACPVEKLFQGPIADAFTHVGQLAMLRRLSGSPIKGENYYKADIVAGRVGMEQSQPRRPFA